MLPLETVLAQLPGVRQIGQRYCAKCPVHEGTHRDSLSLREGRDGRVLLYCFGGCETRDIVETLGLRWSDLFTTPRPSARTPAKRRRLTIDPDRLKNRMRTQITASVLYAAVYLLALLDDRLPDFPCDERLGCYVGLCEVLWTLVLTEGTDAARETWQHWHGELEHTAPLLLAMIKRMGTDGD